MWAWLVPGSWEKRTQSGIPTCPSISGAAPGRAGFKDNLRHRPGNRGGRERTPSALKNAVRIGRDIVNDPEIDVVSICTPNNVHAEIAIAALNAGKHVLCEKPIASTLEDAKAMAEAAKKAAQKGIIAMNAYQYRRVPAIDLAKKFIDEGSIGKILNVRCTYLQSWVGRSCLPALLAVSERHRRRGDAW